MHRCQVSRNPSISEMKSHRCKKEKQKWILLLYWSGGARRVALYFGQDSRAADGLYNDSREGNRGLDSDTWCKVWKHRELFFFLSFLSYHFSWAGWDRSLGLKNLLRNIISWRKNYYKFSVIGICASSLVRLRFVENLLRFLLEPDGDWSNRYKIIL
jgi:hypothetical protein